MEFEIGCGEVTISSPPDGPRSAEPGVAMLLWRWPLEEEANKGKTANEARRNETETRHEANKGNDKQATKHDDTKQNGTRQRSRAPWHPNSSAAHNVFFSLEFLNPVP